MNADASAKIGGLQKTGYGVAGLTVAAIGIFGKIVAAIVAAFALLGAPLFAVMGGSAELSWLLHSDPARRHVREIAAPVLDSHFADSPILVTIPLFTFVGYLLAEAKTPDRLVRAARALVGWWLPGGLAIVCIITSGAFTLLTGGTGVTIIAVGGLLYPALRKQKYSDNFSLGLVTAGGSVGLLAPFSLPLMVFCLVTNVDLALAFKAVAIPGALVIAMLFAFAVIVGIREKIPFDKFDLKEMGASVWDLKWELLIPVVLVKGLMSGLASIDEVAGLVAVYVFVAEFFLYKDLSIKKDLGRIAKSSMTMAGAIIMILGMANALMHYVELEEIPKKILEVLLKLGIEHRWQFLIVMNIFLLILGMLMEGFSAILVAVPLMLPFVSDLGARHPEEAMSPFHLAMIFILNLELAFCLPPLGLNLFIGSFRFNKPVTKMYRAVLPFLAVLAVALGIVSYVPWFSTVAVKRDIAELRAKSAELGEAPKTAWMLECVQLDPTDPKPCSIEDRKKWASPSASDAPKEPTDPKNPPADPDAPPAPSGDCDPDFGDCSGATKPNPSGKAAPSAAPAKKDCDPDFGPCDGG